MKIKRVIIKFHNSTQHTSLLIFISTMQRLPLYRKITSCFSKFNATRFHRFSSSSNTISNDFNNVKTVIIPLHKRHYFRIEGRDTFKFLQGLITNDMNLLQEEEDCLACAILSPKGRVVADIFAYNTTAPTDDQQVEINLCVFLFLFLI